jgi:uncharacterized membrane protein
MAPIKTATEEDIATAKVLSGLGGDFGLLLFEEVGRSGKGYNATGPWKVSIIAFYGRRLGRATH